MHELQCRREHLKLKLHVCMFHTLNMLTKRYDQCIYRQMQMLINEWCAWLLSITVLNQTETKRLRH